MMEAEAKSYIPEGLSEQGQTGIVPVEFVTGVAGSGKTYLMRQRIAEDPLYGMLASTTGISAMNLGTITINSLLGYFDTESLEEAYINGWLARRLADLAEEGYRWLVVDEISMMDSKQLDLIYMALREVNEARAATLDEEGKPGQPLGMVVTGDYCQLPPIKAKYAFEANCWPAFEANVLRLTKIWRQADSRFLDALNAIRRGDGQLGAKLLASLNVEFTSHADINFQGTTIMAKNAAVDKFNWLAHSRLPGTPFIVTSRRWGQQRSEWKHIPDSLGIKPGAYIMLLSNDTPNFTYVNGDCGYVRGFEDGLFQIELVRNGQTVLIDELTRAITQKHPPDSLLARNPGVAEKELRRGPFSPGSPYWDMEKRRWVIGEISYYPLRLAYATTVHRSQGLTLDRIQVDIHDHFFGAPSMMYVALSRCRTAEGLRIIGTPQLLASRVKVAEEVRRWL